ncbi:MAG: cellulase family glycosylhydrolase [Clostridiales bacterium]|nr:cellulase family glycosylhydrolase [Clostridiales bacterium]
MKKTSILLLFTILLTLVVGLTACHDNPTPSKEHTLPFLTVNGKYVVDDNGNKVVLRGVNAGGLGVIERWMTGFDRNSSVARDHYSISKIWLDRFGYKDTVALWEIYQENWWTETDFKNCAAMGINVIRLPFTYMDIDFGAVVNYDNAGKFDFTFLDNFVDMAEQYGIYTILDLHGAYGSQNGQDHSGLVLNSASQVSFYKDERMINLTTNLWRAVAEHFKDNPAVAGYDLLNEPVEKGNGSTGERHWAVLDRFYDAIRATGDNHVVIFESCWGAEGLPKPADYEWSNCMYSFHHYTGCAGNDRVEEHCKSFESRLREIENAKFGVPLYMGEFTCYTNQTQWTYTLDLLNRRGWHWTSWTYKIWGTSGWGIYNIRGEDWNRVNASADELSEIRKKFRYVLTENSTTTLYTFASGKTLFDVIRESCISVES